MGTSGSVGLGTVLRADMVHELVTCPPQIDPTRMFGSRKKRGLSLTPIQDGASSSAAVSVRWKWAIADSKWPNVKNSLAPLLMLR